MTHLLSLSVHQNPNVGLYGFANDKVCFVGTDVSEEDADKIEKVLKVPVHRLSVYRSSLVGAFATGNNSCILLPAAIEEHELTVIVKLLEYHGIKHHILSTDYNALGNNLIANDQACIISPVLEPLKDEIAAALGVKHIEINPMQYIPTIGSLISLNGKGCLASAFINEEQADWMSQLFGVPVTRGTINLGSPFVGAGIITNRNGFVYGDRTGGPEAVAADEALGFLQQ